MKKAFWLARSEQFWRCAPRMRWAHTLKIGCVSTFAPTGRDRNDSSTHSSLRGPSRRKMGGSLSRIIGRRPEPVSAIIRTEKLIIRKVVFHRPPISGLPCCWPR